MHTEPARYKVNWRRYRRTLRFAAWLFARVLLWELVLRRLRGERFVRRGRSRRLRGWAHEFRVMASEMGGVMIKLGQFVSSRMDILPPEMIEELAALQDEVPTVPFDIIRQTLEAEIGPLTETFAAFSETPVAAASLGQAHRAQFPNGERVIVKVQRPGIRDLVHTDLSALGVVAGWAMKLPFIAHRAHVPALLNEFSAVLWEELDYTHEADHAEAFAQMFAGDKGVYIPHLYRQCCTQRVVTLEDVTAIKITDYERIETAGIDRRDVARRLIDTYLWMVFNQRFYHADPHPGNLFVYPLPPDASPGSGESRNGHSLSGRPFYLIFVDFGMVGRLTPQIEAGLREALIAFTLRDAHRVVQAYQRLGMLLPGADLDRLEQASRAAFDKVWGLNLSQISHMQFSEAVELGHEFRDLIFSMPFQVPQDFLYLARCIGILVGLCTGLDPSFNPWREVAPFASTLLDDSREARSGPLGFIPHDLRDLLKPQTLRTLLSGENADLLLETGLDMARRAIQLPVIADDVLRRADRGDLAVRAAPTPEFERQVGRLEHAAHRLSGAVVFAGLAVSSAILYTGGAHTPGTVGLVLSGLALLRVLFSNGAS